MQGISLDVFVELADSLDLFAELQQLSRQKQPVVIVPGRLAGVDPYAMEQCVRAIVLVLDESEVLINPESQRQRHGHTRNSNEPFIRYC